MFDIPTPAKRLQIFQHYLAPQSLQHNTAATGVNVKLVGDIPLELISDRCHGFVGTYPPILALSPHQKCALEKFLYRCGCCRVV